MPTELYKYVAFISIVFLFIGFGSLGFFQVNLNSRKGTFGSLVTESKDYNKVENNLLKVGVWGVSIGILLLILSLYLYGQ